MNIARMDGTAHGMPVCTQAMSLKWQAHVPERHRGVVGIEPQQHEAPKIKQNTRTPRTTFKVGIHPMTAKPALGIPPQPDGNSANTGDQTKQGYRRGQRQQHECPGKDLCATDAQPCTGAKTHQRPETADESVPHAKAFDRYPKW
jgi:hypothetical protein